MLETLVPGSPWRLILAGCGRVGTAVAELLRRSGHSVVGVASRSPESVTRAQRLLEAPRFSLDGPLPDCEVVLVGASDAAIEPLVARLAPHLQANTIVWHFAGAFGLAPLAAAQRAGALGLALHPVQTCPDVASALRLLPESAWGLTAPEPVADWAAGVVEHDLRGRAFLVAEEHRPIWHAASVATANGIRALVALSEDLLTAVGIAEPSAVVLPAARGALDTTTEGGSGASLTGPVVRGETATIARHLDSLARYAPARLAGYRLVTEIVLRAALDAGRIEEEDASAMRAVLDG
jgi:predicted short-subunit dehydrogenase-like oxidoreductase (DUF2520 family)